VRDLIRQTSVYRQCRDWSKIADDVANPMPLVYYMDHLETLLPALRSAQQAARRLADRYPESDGARVLGELLAMGDEAVVAGSDYEQRLKDERRQLVRQVIRVETASDKEQSRAARYSPYVATWQYVSVNEKTVPVRRVPAVRLSNRLGWQPLFASGSWGYVVLPNMQAPEERLVYVGNRFMTPARGRWTLCLGHDCPFRLFVDGKPVGIRAHVGSLVADAVRIAVPLNRGIHEIVIALKTKMDIGRFSLRFKLDRDVAIFPVRV